MWRSFFIAIGIMLAIVGVECLLIESATLYSGNANPPPTAQTLFGQSAPQSGGTRVFRPGEWLPLTTLASGVIVIMYSMTLPKRWQHG
jgi:hypothetical protein